MADKKNIQPVSKVLQQPGQPGTAASTQRGRRPDSGETDFQLNSMGGPLDESFTG
ncbi:MAG: hypothetical protein ACYDEQ_02925 [Desulfocucumaceae bacterium]